jgi:hypothetical protein
MKAISADKIINAEILDPRELDYPDDTYSEFLDFFGEEDMGRYDVITGIILDVGGTYILGYNVAGDDDDENYAIGDGKGNWLTLQDLSKFLRKFNRQKDWEAKDDVFTEFKKSLGVKPQSINDMEEEWNIKGAKGSNLLILDVPREVLNWYKDVKKRDLVPFETLVKAVNQWVDKAKKEQNSEALGEALMALYKEYGINYSKASGSWKKYKG